MNIPAVLAVSFILAASPAAAEPLFLFGAVGKASVLMRLTVRETAVDGWYLYFASDRDILISGKLDKDGAFALEEKSGGKATGRFQGVARGDEWTGTWTKPDGTSPTPFAARAAHGAPPDFSGPIVCASRRDKEFGWTYSYSLRLALAKGAVADFEASLQAKREGDEQGCGFSREDFAPASTSVGLLMRARDVEGQGPDSPKCTVRIVGDSDHLYVGFGETGAENDDCHSSGTTVFCTPRGAMPTLIIDRRTLECRDVTD